MLVFRPTSMSTLWPVCEQHKLILLQTLLPIMPLWCSVCGKFVTRPLQSTSHTDLSFKKMEWMPFRCFWKFPKVLIIYHWTTGITATGYSPLLWLFYAVPEAFSIANLSGWFQGKVLLDFSVYWKSQSPSTGHNESLLLWTPRVEGRLSFLSMQLKISPTAKTCYSIQLSFQLLNLQHLLCAMLILVIDILLSDALLVLVLLSYFSFIYGWTSCPL